MSSPFTPKADSLKFEYLIKSLRDIGENLLDPRTGENTKYEMSDAVLSAFSLFFTQSCSFLAHQRDMQRDKGQSNANSLFGVFKLPSDQQIKNLLDPVKPNEFYPIFEQTFNLLNGVGTLDDYRTPQSKLLVALDGVYYFSSHKISCNKCRTQQHKNGTVTYSHAILAAVLVGVNQPVVFPLPPEFLTPQDGYDKQDSEIAAAKRWLESYAKFCKDNKIVLLADDIFCHQPLCKLLIDAGVEFIFVCKPDSHKILYGCVEDLEKTGSVEHLKTETCNGKQHEMSEYRIAKQVPLREGDDVLRVNFFECTIRRKEDNKVLYHNAFATQIDITTETVVDYTEQGRARWKIENENNNTLKNQGYHFEHNFGHGSEYLSMTLLTLNLIAFLFHGVLSLMDANYQLVRNALGSRETFFNDIRALTRYLYFDSFQALLCFMVERLELKPVQQISTGKQMR